MNLKVLIYGIQSETNLHLNGRYGKIQGWDNNKQRYYINIITDTNITNANANTNVDGDNNTIISLKPSNIVYLKGTVVQVVTETEQQSQQSRSNEQQQQLNGRWGTVVEFIEFYEGGTTTSGNVSVSGRYDIQLSTNTIVRVKLDNVRV